MARKKKLGRPKLTLNQLRKDMREMIKRINTIEFQNSVEQVNKLNFYPNIRAKETWTTGSGREIRVCDMSTDHIRNAKNIIEKSHPMFIPLSQELSARENA